jgi:UDP-N-acetylglucosamine 2-epimerase (non-hydrolysing)
MAFEEICLKVRPDCVIIVGDVNSALACSIVSKKLNIEVAHVEAGLRSFDLSMPEEINRIVTDSISDYFFVTEESGVQNLLHEGKPPERIHLVGNVMIDNLFYQLGTLHPHVTAHFPTESLKTQHKGYALLTLHRPSNVDVEEVFSGIAEAINRIAEDRAVFFPVHPRTRKSMEAFQITFCENVVLLPPLGFREILYLLKDASIVMTDSGGIQEETTALGVPCLTLRENTERPITISLGSNHLVGTQTRSILDAYSSVMNNGARPFATPPYWDGKASERIWRVLCEAFSGGG